MTPAQLQRMLSLPDDDPALQTPKATAAEAAGVDQPVGAVAAQLEKARAGKCVHIPQVFANGSWCMSLPSLS